MGAAELKHESKRLIKQVASPMLDRLGVFDGAVDKLKTTEGAWTILMYHRVVADRADDPFGLGMCVQRRHFEEQLAYLAREFTPIGMREAIATLQSGETLPPRALSITFDDGYLDNLTEAAPLLHKFGLPWTLFVATGGLEDNTPFWWDRVIRAFAATRAHHFDPREVGFRGLERPMQMQGVQRKISLEATLGALWDLPIESALLRVSLIEKALLDPSDSHKGPLGTRMNRQQLLALSRMEGIEIEAHTVSHPNMALLSEEQRSTEITASRRYLEDLLDRPVVGFAYPGGRANAEVGDAVDTAGFEFAVGTVSGINLPPYETMELVRVGMPDTGVADFKRALGKAVRRSFAPGSVMTTIRSPFY